MNETTSSELWGLLCVVLFVVANGFFVAAEFSLVSVRRSRIEQLVAEGHRRAGVVQAALRDLDRYIAGTQVGITMASIALGWIGEPVLAHLLERLWTFLPAPAASAASHGLAVAIAFTLITFLHVVFGELVPKSVALQRTEPVALWIAPPMRWAVLLFQPLIWSLNGVGNFVLRRVGLEPAGESHSVHSPKELQILVRQSRQAGLLEEMESNLLQRTFRFSEATARDVMVPRNDIMALDSSQPAEKLLEEAAQANHTRLPVYVDSIDNVIGILHLQDLFRQLRRNPAHLNLRELLRPALVVPESIRLDRLLLTFQQKRAQMALVVDEHGGVAGLLTLDDVVEEIVGDVEETEAASVPGIRIAKDGRVLVRGDVRLRDLNEKLGWQLSDPAASTIAGLVINRLGRLAVVGDCIETPHGAIRVERMNRVRIVELSITPKS
ncbi:MAG: HlyC/CorC family transporter [Verrucomicrobia bacterium]|nr:HlyC/CorC family transporter [Verrucomicrobiota bacterium]